MLLSWLRRLQVVGTSNSFKKFSIKYTELLDIVEGFRLKRRSREKVVAVWIFLHRSTTLLKNTEGLIT